VRALALVMTYRLEGPIGCRNRRVAELFRQCALTRLGATSAAPPSALQFALHPHASLSQHCEAKPVKACAPSFRRSGTKSGCRYAARLLLPHFPDLLLVEASPSAGGRIKQVGRVELHVTLVYTQRMHRVFHAAALSLAASANALPIGRSV